MSNQFDDAIEIVRHDIALHGETPQLKERLEELLLERAQSFREEMDILARAEALMRPIFKALDPDTEGRCVKCGRLVQHPGRRLRPLCRGCEEDEKP